MGTDNRVQMGTDNLLGFGCPPELRAVFLKSLSAHHSEYA